MNAIPAFLASAGAMIIISCGEPVANTFIPYIWIMLLLFICPHDMTKRKGLQDSMEAFERRYEAYMSTIK